MSEENPPAKATAPRAAVWEDFVDIFVSPSRVFERRIHGQYGAALVTLMLVTLVLGFLFFSAMRPIVDAGFNEAMRRAAEGGREITPEQLSATRTFAAIVSVAAYPFFIALAVVLLATAISLITLVQDSRVGFKQAMTIATYASIPRLLDQVSMGVQAFLLDESSITSRTSISLSAARFVDATSASPLVVGLLSRIDVFAIWVTVLIAIGLRSGAKLPAGTARLLALLIYLLASLFAVLTLLRQS